MNSRQKLIEIFNEALKAVLPGQLIRNTLHVGDDHLEMGGRRYEPAKGRGVHVFGSGKASLPAARAVEEMLGERIAGGVIVTSHDDGSLTRLAVQVGAHPVPDQRSIDAARVLAGRLGSLGEDDFFIYLLSGGSSALLEWPVPPVTLPDLQATTRLILEGGLTIDEMNAVRKHLSLVKGGRLGLLTQARGVVLVISDVIGDDLQTIGSAPFYYDRTDYREVSSLLARYGLWEKLPASVAGLFADGLAGTREDTPKEPNPRVDHLLIGSNTLVVRRAREKAQALGVPARIMSTRLRGEAREVARVLVAMGEEILASGTPFAPPVCLLFGGETTVTVRGSGRGGRNQEMCAAALREIGDRRGLLFFSAGTDGIDGNSHAAGAMVDHASFARARELGLRVDDFLRQNDTNQLLARTGDLVVTGPTGTNVMDLTMLFIGGDN
jgi:hydroxypyruvate reductase/glycerate 2-kinase